MGVTLSQLPVPTLRVEDLPRPMQAVDLPVPTPPPANLPPAGQPPQVQMQEGFLGKASENIAKFLTEPAKMGVFPGAPTMPPMMPPGMKTQPTEAAQESFEQPIVPLSQLTTPGTVPHGAAQALEGLTTPVMTAAAVAGGPISRASNAIDVAMRLYFTEEVGRSAVAGAKDLWKAYQAGDLEKVKEGLGFETVQAMLLGVLSWSNYKKLGSLRDKYKIAPKPGEEAVVREGAEPVPASRQLEVGELPPPAAEPIPGPVPSRPRVVKETSTVVETPFGPPPPVREPFVDPNTPPPSRFGIRGPELPAPTATPGAPFVTADARAGHVWMANRISPSRQITEPEVSAEIQAASEQEIEQARQQMADTVDALIEAAPVQGPPVQFPGAPPKPAGPVQFPISRPGGPPVQFPGGSTPPVVFNTGRVGSLEWVNQRALQTYEEGRSPDTDIAQTTGDATEQSGSAALQPAQAALPLDVPTVLPFNLRDQLKALDKLTLPEAPRSKLTPDALEVYETIAEMVRVRTGFSEDFLMKHLGHVEGTGASKRWVPLDRITARTLHRFLQADGVIPHTEIDPNVILGKELRAYPTPEMAEAVMQGDGYLELSLDDQHWSTQGVIDASTPATMENIRKYPDADAVQEPTTGEWYLQTAPIHSAQPFTVSPTARMIVINSQKTLNSAVKEVNKIAGRRVNPSSQDFLRILARNYDILAIARTRVPANQYFDFFKKAGGDKVVVLNQKAVMARGGSEAGSVPLDFLTLGISAGVRRLMAHFGTPQASASVQKDLDRFNKANEAVNTLLQLAERNPGVKPLQDYISNRENEAARINRITGQAGRVMRSWNNLGRKRGYRLSNYIFQVSQESFDLGRRLTPTELAAHGQTYKMDQDMQDVYSDLIKFLDDHHREGGNATLHSMARSGASKKTLLQAKNSFDSFQARNPFPMVNFGRHAIVVRDTQGSGMMMEPLVALETFGTEIMRNRRMKEIHRTYPAPRYKVRADTLGETTYGLEGFPEPWAKWIMAHLSRRAPHQESLMHELRSSAAPGFSYFNFLRRTHGQEAFAAEAYRAFENYAYMMAHHIGRLEFMDQAKVHLAELNGSADTAVNPVTRRNMAAAMQRHFDVSMDPGNDLPMLRTPIFLAYFWLMPRQALINLAQVPGFSIPYLADTNPQWGAVREAKAVAAIDKARRDLYSGLRRRGDAFDEARLTTDERILMNRGEDHGLYDKGYMSEVVAAAHGDFLANRFPHTRPGYYINKLANAGVSWWKASEEVNRRVTGLALVRAALERGDTMEAAFQYMKKGVQTTQGEYGAWNSPRWFRGPVGKNLLMFKRYEQLVLEFVGIFGNPQPGRGRALLMMLLLQGVKGLPFATLAAALYNLLGSGIRKKMGVPEPLVDVEKSLRETMAEWGANPDLVMNGLSRYTFGAYHAGKLFGLPLPALDFSSSMQLGNIIPGAQPMLENLHGTMDARTTVLRTMGELLGAGGGTGIRLMEGLLEDDPMKASLLIGVLRNMALAGQYATTGQAVDRQGRKLVDFDVRNPEHVLEIMGQALLTRPTRLAVEQNLRLDSRKAAAYYQGWRRLTMQAWVVAKVSGDGDKIEKAREMWEEFNEMAPNQFRISYEDREAAVTEGRKNRRISDQGLPVEKQMRQMYEEYKRAFPD